MTITSKTEGDKITVSLEGRLDTNTSPALETELSEILKRGRLNLVLDFSKLEYISSAGLRILLNAQKKTNDVVGTMVVENVNDTIMEVFDMTGFSDFLTVTRAQKNSELKF